MLTFMYTSTLVTCYASGLYLCLPCYVTYVVLGWGGWGGGMLTFMYTSTLVTCHVMLHVFSFNLCKTKIFSDGNRSCESHAKSLKIPHAKVCHQNKEWTKKISKGRSQHISNVAGTQIADRGWLSLKKIIPSSFPRRLGYHRQVKEHPEVKKLV